MPQLQGQNTQPNKSEDRQLETLMTVSSNNNSLGNLLRDISQIKEKRISEGARKYLIGKLGLETNGQGKLELRGSARILRGGVLDEAKKQREAFNTVLKELNLNEANVRAPGETRKNVVNWIVGQELNEQLSARSIFKIHEKIGTFDNPQTKQAIKNQLHRDVVEEIDLLKDPSRDFRGKVIDRIAKSLSKNGTGLALSKEEIDSGISAQSGRLAEERKLHTNAQKN